MLTVNGALFLLPQDTAGSVLNASDKILISQEIEAFLSGKTDEKRVREKLSPILKRMRAGAEGKKLVFSLANRVYIAGHTSLASFMISAVHDRVSPSKLAVLLNNFVYAKRLLEGTPYNHGYIAANGCLTVKSGGPGLNCITMNNILINLTVGARVYTEKLAGDPKKKKETNEDIFTKPELISEGVYSFPVINNYSGKRIDKLPGLLRNYGHYFAAQLYSSDGTPYHTVFIYRKGGQYRVLDTLAAGNIFADIGELTALEKKYGSWMTYNINLVDTEQVRPIARAKSKTFLLNLQRTIEKAKK